MRNELDLSGRGAVYHRVSDDAQDVGRQRAETQRVLDRHGATVPKDRVYEDLGWKRYQAASRPAFQRLLRDADDGKVDWVLIDRQDRAEAADPLEFFSVLHRLKKAGCRLYTVDGRDLTSLDVGSLVTTTVESHKSRSEQQEKAARVLSQKIQRAKRGEWQGGHVPYACDVACLALPDLKEQWRVRIDGRDARVKVSPDGTERQYNGRGNFPASEAGQILQLRPSLDDDRLDVVRRVFQTYDEQSISLAGIAKKLNREGVKANYGKAWEGGLIRRLLENPVYLGRQPFNRSSQGRYMEFAGGGRREVADAVKHKSYRKRDVADWALSDELFPPIVDPDLFDRVQKKLARQDKTTKHRSPVNATCWLSRLLFCQHCGQRMRAYARPNRKHEYACSSYGLSAATGNPSPCKRNSVLHSEVEAYLGEYLRDAGADLSTLTTAETPTEHPLSQRLRELTDRAVAAQREMTRRLGLTPLQAYEHDDLEGAYRQRLAADGPKLAKERAALDREHDRLTAQVGDDLPPLARKKLVARLAELEARMEAIDAQTADVSQDAEAAEREIWAVLLAWQGARDAVEGDASGRAKAEAVGRLLQRIDLSFRPTGRKRPVTELASLTFHPVGGQGAAPVVRVAPASRRGPDRNHQACAPACPTGAAEGNGLSGLLSRLLTRTYEARRRALTEAEAHEREKARKRRYWHRVRARRGGAKKTRGGKG